MCRCRNFPVPPGIAGGNFSSVTPFLGILLLFFVVLPAGMNAQTVEDTATERLGREIERMEGMIGGTIGIGAVHLESGKEFYFNRYDVFPMASTYKIPIAVRLLERVDGGEINLRDMVTIEETDLHPGSGIISRLLDDPGVSLSLQNLLELMLLISDNSAADLCLRAAGGPAAVTQSMRNAGLHDIQVTGPTYALIAGYYGITSLDDKETFSRELYDEGFRRLTDEDRDRAIRKISSSKRDAATPFAMAQLLRKIWNREILSEENSDYLIDILKRVETGTGRLKGILPAGTTVFHKTGTIGGTTNDVGIIELPGDAGHVVTVVFVKDVKYSTEREEIEKVIAQAARTVYDYFLFTTR